MSLRAYAFCCYTIIDKITLTLLETIVTRFPSTMLSYGSKLWLHVGNTVVYFNATRTIYNIMICRWPTKISDRQITVIIHTVVVVGRYTPVVETALWNYYLSVLAAIYYVIIVILYHGRWAKIKQINITRKTCARGDLQCLLSRKKPLSLWSRALYR